MKERKPGRFLKMKSIEKKKIITWRDELTELTNQKQKFMSWHTSACDTLLILWSITWFCFGAQIRISWKSHQRQSGQQNYRDDKSVVKRKHWCPRWLGIGRSCSTGTWCWIWSPQQVRLWRGCFRRLSGAFRRWGRRQTSRSCSWWRYDIRHNCIANLDHRNVIWLTNNALDYMCALIRTWSRRNWYSSSAAVPIDRGRQETLLARCLAIRLK